MAIYELRDLTFTYPTRETPAVNNLSLSIEAGEFVTLVGPSGCGKTTLLKLLKPSLSPHGARSGEILFDGAPLSSLSEREAATRIGFVAQDPEHQAVTDKVWHELSFGLESLGIKTPEIRARVSEMASFFGMEDRFHQKVADLSGGQKQLLNLASVMVMEPEVLLLDEPTAQLSPMAAEEFLSMLRKINRELGVTVILSEHRLEDVLPLSDRVAVLSDGAPVLCAPPREAAESLYALHHPAFESLPTPLRVFAGTGNKLPLTVREGREELSRFASEHPLSPERIPAAPLPNGKPPLLSLKEVSFRYEKDAPDILHALSLSIPAGEMFALLGGNGAGKTTLLSLLAGLRRPTRGKITLQGAPLWECTNRIALLPQDPTVLFLKKTVRLDLLDALSELRIPAEEKERRVLRMAKLCRIDAHMDAHPFDLSGGEQERAALAKLLLCAPEVLLLDEPTRGMDAAFKKEFGAILAALTRAGKTVILVSHDIEFCARYAHRCALLFDGGITSEGMAREFFTGKHFYTTAANRMARRHLPEAVLPEDILLAMGRELPPDPPSEPPTAWEEEFKESPPPRAPRSPVSVSEHRLSPRTKAAAALCLLAVPATMFFGIWYLGDRKYYFVSLLILLEISLPFVLSFEGRKPKARELVILSVLVALGVAGRIAFFMLPQFKPVVALVVLSGVAFGGEAGFLVGAMTAFVSDMYFGQGPWTPWQMFAFGLIGFFAGVLFRKGLLGQGKLALSLFGGLSALILYGGIMNPASVLMSVPTPTKEMILSAYAVGIPMDLIHALATAVFLWFLSDPMLEKLERVKVKYGLLEPSE